MGAGMEYPKGRAGKYFSHRVIRLMLRTCAAQYIGCDGFALVVAIASTEDAKRYTGAVTFWNEQLAPLLAMSWGQLDRARRKAVSHGWLYYKKGGKGKVGVYWTLIPERFEELSAGPVDCDIGEFVSTELRNQTGKKRDQSAEQSVRETGDKRGTSAEHPTLTLTPYPIPSPKDTTAADAASVQTPKEPTAFDRFWKVYPRRTARGAAVTAFAKAVKRADAETIISSASEFAASPKGRGEFVPHPATWLNQDRWTDDRAAWQDSGARNGQPAIPSSGKIHDPTDDSFGTW